MTGTLDNWSRPYFEDSTQMARLSFAVFGRFDKNEEFEQACSVLPPGAALGLTDAEDLQNGAGWELCREETPELAERVEGCSGCAVLTALIQDQESLDYLKTSLDVITFLTDTGGEVVYDADTLSWHPREKWSQLTDAGQIFNPFDHVAVVRSRQPDGVWLHTRGMIKFGRPDLSARAVPAQQETHYRKVIDRFINFQALGGAIELGRVIQLEGTELSLVTNKVKGSLEDPTFKNFYVEIETV
jgi:hypothetical protein